MITQATREIECLGWSGRKISSGLVRGGSPGGGAALPYKRLMGMCRWMGSHFHNWIDYNGVAHFLILGVRQFFIFTVGEK